MEQIIIASIQVVGTIAVAIISLMTKNKIEKIDIIKANFQKEIEKRMAQSDNADKEIIKKIQDLSKTVDFNDIDAVRNRIVAFENLCRLDVNNNEIKLHQYKTYFKDEDKWAMYHKKYPELNGEINVAIESINEHYKKAKFD